MHKSDKIRLPVVFIRFRCVLIGLFSGCTVKLALGLRNDNHATEEWFTHQDDVKQSLGLSTAATSMSGQVLVVLLYQRLPVTSAKYTSDY